MEDKVGVLDGEFFENEGVEVVGEEFDSESFKEANALARLLPSLFQAEGCPSVARDNADTP
jgi:hypothetical protein